MGICPVLVDGQENGVDIKVGEKSDSHFQVSSGISVSFTGPQYFYEFNLVDENGFAYDTWSLVRSPEFVKQVGLTEQQVHEMSVIREANKKELIAEMSKGWSTEESKARIEQRFRAAELEIQSVIQPEQLELFQNAKNQKNIAQVGFAEFLSSDAIRTEIGLAQEDVDSLASTTDEIKLRINENAERALREANLELLAHLSAQQQAEFEELVVEKERVSLLGIRLFSADASKSRIRKAVRPDFLRLLVRSKKTREKIDLGESQFEEIKQLKSKRDAEPDEGEKGTLEGEIKTILDSDQYRALLTLTIEKEARRGGTVNALCGGSLGRCLGLSDEENQRLFDVGKEINDVLVERLLDSKRNAWQAAICELPKSKQDEIMKMIGRPMDAHFE